MQKEKPPQLPSNSKNSNKLSEKDVVNKEGAVEELLSKMELVLANQGKLQSNNNRIWFDRAAAADYLLVSEKTIDRYRSSKKLRRHVMDGSSTFRFRRDDLDKLMRS